MTLIVHRVEVLHRPRMTTAITSAPGLLTLPPELRNQIYSYVLFPPGVSMLCVWWNREAVMPAICQTNRQLRAECCPLFFGKNRFNLATIQISAMSNERRLSRRWIRSLDDSQTTMLGRLTFWREDFGFELSSGELENGQEWTLAIHPHCLEDCELRAENTTGARRTYWLEAPQALDAALADIGRKWRELTVESLLDMYDAIHDWLIRFERPFVP